MDKAGAAQVCVMELMRGCAPDATRNWGGVMVVRILQFLIGAVLAGGGGYLAWLNRADFGTIFPPGPAGPPWMLVLAVMAIASGLVFLVSAVHPRPARRAELEAHAEARDAQLKEAEVYYSEAGRAADRDWRSGDIAPPVAPIPPPPEPPPEPAASPAVEPVAAPAPAEPAPAAPAPPGAAPAPPPAPEPVPQPAPEPAPAVASVFPSAASLGPIPAASEPPPATVATAPPPDQGPHSGIRLALKEGRLDEAERLLEAARETAQGLELAELTGLAGDHAAAAGRQSHAKWLWRLALRRFGEAGQLEAPAARAVAEALRTLG
ncbi:MAG: hypothetical protein R3C46_09230 [Hyphomonadaceae bacterium]